MNAVSVLAKSGRFDRPFRARLRIAFRKAVYFESEDSDFSFAMTSRKTNCSPGGIRLDLADVTDELDLEFRSILEYDGARARIGTRWFFEFGSDTSDETQTIGVGSGHSSFSFAEWERLTTLVCCEAGQDHELWKLRLKGQDLLKDSSGFPHVSTVLPLLGWGSGSTPSGDDFIAGLVAALQRYDRFPASWANFLSQSLSSTCFLSRHFLAACLEGRVDGALAEVLKAFDPRVSAFAQSSFVRLFRQGDRSGRATLLGYFTGCALASEVRS